MVPVKRRFGDQGDYPIEPCFVVILTSLSRFSVVLSGLSSASSLCWGVSGILCASCQRTRAGYL